MIRYTAIKPIMWGGVIALLMFSFPLQVLFLNPYPALLPYIIVIIIFLLTIKHSNNNAIYRQNKNINNIIYAYISLVLLHNLWQTAAGYITVVDAVSSILIFIFPVSFYYYFSKYATKKEINSVLVVVGICGLISGIYFVLDSYSMMVLGKVNDFSYKAIDYSILRQHSGDGAFNPARISLGSRSHGFLEKHAISAAWISIGCFAVLALLPQYAVLKRVLIISLYGSLLSLSLNFTSIFAFLIVICLIELRGYLLLRGNFSTHGIKMFISLFMLFALLGFMLFIIAFNMFDAIINNLSYQINLALGIKDLREGPIIWHIFNSFFMFFENMLDFPLGVFIGDGFSHWGVITKGGDWGLAETLHRFGLPLFTIVLVGLYRTLKLFFKHSNMFFYKNQITHGHMLFSVSVVIYSVVASIHYTVWSAKSILPLFFIGLAIISRSFFTNVSSTEHS